MLNFVVERVKKFGNVSSVKDMFFIAACVAFASQFHLTYFVEGFIITLSVIVLAFLLYQYDTINPFVTLCITAIVSPVFRGMIDYTLTHNLVFTLKRVMPDIIFYVAYGALFTFLYQRRPKRELAQFLGAVFFSDMGANICEILVRTKVIGFDVQVIKYLAGIALVRTFIVFGLICILKQYNAFLNQEAHEMRYRKLVLQISGFKSELYFLHKNTHEIEDVMKKSFQLYRNTVNENYAGEIQQLALGIAKDIHEIKKDYIRVIQGLEELSPEVPNMEGMSLRDLMSILHTDLKEQIQRHQLDVSLEWQMNASGWVKQHFYLMSVLRNLAINALEAMEGQKNGRLRIDVRKYEDNYQLIISDNGPGIREDNLEFIFNPGFTTKFHKETGEIGRGVGLTLVHDLVRDTFHGDIQVKSSLSVGTTFNVTIPVTELGGE